MYLTCYLSLVSPPSCLFLFSQASTLKWRPSMWMERKWNSKSGKRCQLWECFVAPFRFSYAWNFSFNVACYRRPLFLTFARVCRDTAGQERFKTITTAYYRGAMVSHRRRSFCLLRLFFAHSHSVFTVAGHHSCVWHHRRKVLRKHPELDEEHQRGEAVSPSD